MVSNLDYLHALNPAKTKDEEQRNNAEILKNMRVEEIMSENVIVASPEDTIRTILELFNKNVYHAIPIMEKNKLVGIITTQDIIYTLLNPPSGVRHIRNSSFSNG
jgi:predicted transcriptional regulator